MKIFYGELEHFVNVTEICLLKLTINNIITIPYGDSKRSQYFNDHLPGVFKKIIIEHDGMLSVYPHYKMVKINILDNTIRTINEFEIYENLLNIHSKISINHGSMNNEVPEQKMVVSYLTGVEKVLEIGGNIGRNSLVIASILKDNTNLVTLECDKNIAKQLEENRDLNNFKFHIENSALSKRKLIQKGWDTLPSDTLHDGYNWVNTITLEELNAKYNIKFDTLVLDCEGAFYYILMDMPEILNNINLIIMENDYKEIEKKNYVDEILGKHNFFIDYTEGGGWGCCSNNFFEVWKRMETVTI
jgi:FkbM family methyltransferase